MDIQLYAVQAGKGKPLILLHGNGEDHRYFCNQIPFFAKNHRVIAIDTRGHGKSPRGEAPFTIGQFALDLRDFLDAHSIKRADILGFSDGGNVALTFALANPERVRRLILCGANLNPAGVKRSVQRPIEIGYRIASAFAKRSEKAAKKAEMLGLMVNGPHISPADLRHLEAPTLVIAGTRDMIRNEHTRMISKNIPHSDLVLLEGDHFLAAKHPESFNQAVERFLSDKRHNRISPKE